MKSTVLLPLFRSSTVYESIQLVSLELAFLLDLGIPKTRIRRLGQAKTHPSSSFRGLPLEILGSRCLYSGRYDERDTSRLPVAAPALSLSVSTTVRSTRGIDLGR